MDASQRYHLPGGVLRADFRQISTCNSIRMCTTKILVRPFRSRSMHHEGLRSRSISTGIEALRSELDSDVSFLDIRLATLEFEADGSKARLKSTQPDSRSGPLRRGKYRIASGTAPWRICIYARATRTLPSNAATNQNVFEDFFLNAKARIWPWAVLYVPYSCDGRLSEHASPGRFLGVLVDGT